MGNGHTLGGVGESGDSGLFPKVSTPVLCGLRL